MQMLLKADFIRCPLEKVDDWYPITVIFKRHMFIFHVAISDINIPNKKLYACDSKQLFINFF